MRLEFVCDVCAEVITELADGRVAWPPRIAEDAGVLSIEDIIFVMDAIGDGMRPIYHVHTEPCWWTLDERIGGNGGGYDSLQDYVAELRQHCGDGTLFDRVDAESQCEEEL
jgi:hypothetical protein